MDSSELCAIKFTYKIFNNEMLNFNIIFIQIYTHNNMKVNFNGKEIELRYSLRIFIIYENLMDGSEIKEDYLTLVTLLYSTLVATLQYRREPIDIDYQSFLDWIDDNGGIGLITEFSKWFSEQSSIQMGLVGQQEEKKEDESLLDKHLKKS